MSEGKTEVPRVTEENPEISKKKTIESLLRSEKPEEELALQFLGGQLDEPTMAEYEKVLQVAFRDKQLDRQEIQGLLRAGEISEETLDAFAPFLPEELPTPELTTEEIESKLVAEANRLMGKFKGSEIPSGEIETLRARLETLPIDKQKRIRSSMMGSILDEAEHGKASSTMENFRVVFREQDHRLAESIFAAYRFLHEKEGFALTRYEAKPPPTVSNIVLVRNKLANWFAQGGKAGRDKAELEAALRGLDEFILRIPGWDSDKERILLERVVADTETLLDEQKKELFPKKSEMLDQLAAEYWKKTEETRQLLSVAQSSSSPLTIRPLLDKLSTNYRFLDGLKRYSEDLQKRRAKVEKAPKVDRRFLEGLALLRLAHLIPEKIERRRLILEKKRRYLRVLDLSREEREVLEKGIRGDIDKRMRYRLRKYQETADLIKEIEAQIEDFEETQASYEARAEFIFEEDTAEEDALLRSL
ncbi:MAG: hypothetical protein HYT34_01890 [Candidatus Ryanbacteria bacterium]|nr:hypothetical protein [Candidatus Ryanbacteria bacterium]